MPSLLYFQWHAFIIHVIFRGLFLFKLVIYVEVVNLVRNKVNVDKIRNRISWIQLTEQINSILFWNTQKA